VHTPGVKVAIPSTPADAKGLLAAAIRDPDPVVSSSRSSSTALRAARCRRASTSCRSAARLAREGTDVTLVAYGAMVPVAEAAADELGGEASVEVLDIRTLKPLDEEALLASAAKTGRVVIVQEAPRTLGYAAELAAILRGEGDPRPAGPVLRVTGYDVPYPYWQIEDRTCPRPRASSTRRAACWRFERRGREDDGLARPRRAALRDRARGVARPRPRYAARARLRAAVGAGRPAPPRRGRRRRRAGGRARRGRLLRPRLLAFFNSLPVVRDGLLEAGDARDYRMRFVDVPALGDRLVDQRYDPKGGRVVRYSSGSFAADIEFDEAGFVSLYHGFLERVG
jgi:hypothetical protein